MPRSTKPKTTTKAPPKRSLPELVASGLLTQSDADTLRELAVRIAQINEEQRALEIEKGVTNYNTGERTRGLSDMLEDFLIVHDLTDGFKLENFTVLMQPGSNSRIDAGLLLAEGITPDVINRCTITKSWVSAQVRRDPTRNEPE